MKAANKTILIVEDEVAIRGMISAAVSLAGYQFLEAPTTRDAHRLVIDQKPDLILLDWMLPQGSGIDFCRQLKQNDLTSDIPVIMLTAKDNEDNKIQGLDAGADDYVTKPFSPRELMARIKAILRRTAANTEEQAININGLTLDPVSHRVKTDDRSIDLGPTEYRLLLHFMTHQERVYSRTQLLDHVWGGNVYVEERTVDVHIRRLRKALGKPHDGLIQTVRGSGYRFSKMPADI